MDKRWERVPLAALPSEEEMVRVEVAERAIVVGRVGGALYAFAATCPHASAELAEGALRPGYVVCALHGYRFELKRGTCIKPPLGPRLRLYPLREEDGVRWVRME